MHDVLHVVTAEWQQQTEEQKQRTEQLILDTSAREAELLLRNQELTQQVHSLLFQPLHDITVTRQDTCHVLQ